MIEVAIAIPAIFAIRKFLGAGDLLGLVLESTNRRGGRLLVNVSIQEVGNLIKPNIQGRALRNAEQRFLNHSSKEIQNVYLKGR